MTRLRRALTVPAVAMLEVLLLVTAPLLLLVAAIASAGAGSTRALRSTALVLAYAAIELSTLNRLRRGVDDPNALLREVLTRAYRTVRRILDVRVALEAGSATRDQLSTSQGLVVLARHCGPGDSLFIAWLLVVHYQLRLHVVLKFCERHEPVSWHLAMSASRCVAWLRDRRESHPTQKAPFTVLVLPRNRCRAG